MTLENLDSDQFGMVADKAEAGADQSQSPALAIDEQGDFVDSTGIALLHAGDFVRPMPGSQAVMRDVEGSSGQVVNYYFPIEIEVVGGLSEEHLRMCADFVYDELLDVSRRT
jgi:hypothetical protein